MLKLSDDIGRYFDVFRRPTSHVLSFIIKELAHDVTTTIT